MMRCPTCEAETRVTETRAPEGVRHRVIAALALEVPTVVVRRRACPSCGTFLTVELPLDELQLLRGNYNDA